MAGNVTGVVSPAALNAAERSVLFEAIRVGDMPKIQALLKDRPGPAAESCNDIRQTPLHVAARYGRVPVVNYLIGRCKARADALDVFSDSETAPFAAARHLQFDAMLALARSSRAVAQ